jgi:hypothetical protein
MVSAFKLSARRQAALAKAVAWASRKLTAGMVLGLGFIWLAAGRLPPFLAAASPASPVEVVRAVPVPYLEAAPPERAPLPAPASRPNAPAKILQVVARRSQERRQAQREGESGALGKGGSDASGDKTPPAAGPKSAAPADAKPTAPADAKSSPPADPKAAAKAEPPEPDTWSDAEIIAALRDCLRRLAPLGAEIELAEPVRHERCGAPAPVVLRRIGTGANRVEFQPPPTINCAMVAGLSAWVEKTLQPAAQELLGSPVVRIRNASGYACRNRVGTAFHADRLSEHALANAVDISGFVTADGRTIEVLGQWGPTARELREEQERAWAAAQDAKGAVKEAEKQAAEAARAAVKAERGAERGAVRGSKRDQAKAEAARLKDEAERKKQDAERKKDEAQQREAEWRNSLTRTAEFQRLGRGTDGAEQPARRRRGDRERTADAKAVTPAAVGKGAGGTPVSPEAAFLRRLHKGACGTFGTVLGPDANEAHRNHFHFDLAARKRSAFCE